jgi:HPt (histidine-containing phosphotransfer) domain-containing protein
MHVIEEMLGLFLSTSMSQMEKLEHAERSLNILAWKQTTHQLKGAAQNITAKRFASLCIEAEEIHSLPHPQSGAVIYHLYKELALLRGAIEAHLQRHH